MTHSLMNHRVLVFSIADLAIRMQEHICLGGKLSGSSESLHNKQDVR